MGKKRFCFLCLEWGRWKPCNDSSRKTHWIQKWDKRQSTTTRCGHLNDAEDESRQWENWLSRVEWSRRTLTGSLYFWAQFKVLVMSFQAIYGLGPRSLKNLLPPYESAFCLVQRLSPCSLSLVFHRSIWQGYIKAGLQPLNNGMPYPCRPTSPAPLVGFSMHGKNMLLNFTLCVPRFVFNWCYWTAFNCWCFFYQTLILFLRNSKLPCGLF